MLKKVKLNSNSVMKNIRISINKIAVMCLTAGFIIIPCVESNASIKVNAKEESPAEIEERVFEEIRSGEITNDADAIKVALDQYRERKNKASAISESQQTEDIDDSLSITQVINHEVDKNGNIIENAISTNLIVMDENDHVINARYLDNFDTSKYGEFGAFSIYATMTVSVSKDIGDSFNKVRFNYFDTTLYYGTALKASSLVQSAWLYDYDSLWNPKDDIMKQIVEPQANVNYHYTPTDLRYMPYGSMNLGRECESVINVGSRQLGLRYSYTFEKQNDGKGTWEITIK